MKKGSYLFFNIALFLYMFETLYSIIPSIEKINFFIKMLEIIFLGICILTQKYSNKSIILIMATIIILLLSFRITKSFTFLMLLLFIIASKNIKFEKIVKADLFFKFIMLILLIIFLLTGIMNNRVLYRTNETTARNTFGFDSPNRLGIILLSMILEYVYITREKITLKTNLLILVVSIIIFFLTNSRTSSFCMVLFIVFYYLFIKKERSLFLIPYLIPIFAIISLLLVIMYSNNNEFVLELDKLFSTRIMIGSNFYKNYGIKLLGNYIKNVDEWQGYVYYIDNTYLYLLINHGVIVTFIIITYCFKMFKKLYYDNNKLALIILLVLFIYGLFERSILSIAFNIFLLLGKDILFSDNKVRRRKNE